MHKQTMLICWDSMGEKNFACVERTKRERERDDNNDALSFFVESAVDDDDEKDRNQTYSRSLKAPPTVTILK